MEGCIKAIGEPVTGYCYDCNNGKNSDSSGLCGSAAQEQTEAFEK